MTTLAVGGPARRVERADDVAAVTDVLMRARAQGADVLALGGGSNVVVADAGIDAWVLQYTARHFVMQPTSTGYRVRVGAGLEWEACVAAVVDAGLAGIECLAGIPGQVGATVVQNVGAYGQQIADCLVSVVAVDRRSGITQTFPASSCDLSCRDSAFRGRWRDRGTP